MKNGNKGKLMDNFIMQENDAHYNISQFLLRNKVTGWIHNEILFFPIKRGQKSPQDWMQDFWNQLPIKQQHII